MEPFIPDNRAGGPDVLTIQDWVSRFAGLTAGFSTRNGGVSQPPYMSLNCGLHVNDTDEQVIVNRVRLAEAAGRPLCSWIYAEQVHGACVAVVGEADCGRGAQSLLTALPDADGLVTDEPGVCLGAMFADCVPLYFYDPDNDAVGLAHAGWKGTAQAIAAETIRTMQSAFGTRPDRLEAAIGPSIGSCCYEVDDGIASRLLDTLNGFNTQQPGQTAPVCLPSRNEGRWMLDLQETNRQIMMGVGITPSNIAVTRLCTGCRTDLFFSHRRENGRTGRMAAWIGLR